MTATQPRRRVLGAPTNLVLAEAADTTTVDWTSPGIASTADLRLVNTITGQVEQINDDAQSGTADFVTVLTHGQSYYVLARFLLNGEPGPWTQSNTILSAP